MDIIFFSHPQASFKLADSLALANAVATSYTSLNTPFVDAGVYC